MPLSLRALRTFRFLNLKVYNFQLFEFKNFKNFELLSFATSEPKASVTRINAIKLVISMLRVQKLKIARPMKKSGSSDRLASGPPLALCDGPVCDDPSTCFVQAESLQEKLAAMQSSRMEIEAQD